MHVCVFLFFSDPSPRIFNIGLVSGRILPALGWGGLSKAFSDQGISLLGGWGKGEPSVLYDNNSHIWYSI